MKRLIIQAEYYLQNSQNLGLKAIDINIPFEMEIGKYNAMAVEMLYGELEVKVVRAVAKREKISFSHRITNIIHL